MKYFIGIGISLIATLLISKVLMALNLVHFNNFTVIEPPQGYSSQEKQLQQTGKSMYLVYCSSCHGYNGKGNDGKAQDHTKRIAEKSVLDVIKNGSNNFKSIYPSGMPANLINEQDAKEVAKYVASGLKGAKPKAWSKCAACHDESGEGIAYVAPDIKTYADDLVVTVLKNGKKGVIGTMPSFEGRLTEEQIKAIAAYIRSIN